MVNSMPDMSRCHLANRAAPDLDIIRVIGRTTIRWSKSLNENKTAANERAA
jgi:hypothetical protein